MRRKVAILGLGGIAFRAYLPILAQRDDLELILLSRAQSSVERARRTYRLGLGTTSLDELVLASPKAAFVLSPSPSHFGLAQRLLESGIDVFVEKPATLSSGETLALAELARARSLVLMVGFNRRFAPLNLRARGLWGSRHVGMALLQKHRSGAAHPDLLANYLDDTIHVIDLLRFFCGEGRALVTVRREKEGRLVGAVSLVGLEGGGRAVIVTSLEAGAWRETYDLMGEGASMAAEAFSTLRFTEGRDERVWREPYASDWKPTLEARGFPQQVDHFLSCVDSRMEPETSGFEAYRTQKLLESLVAREVDRSEAGLLG